MARKGFKVREVIEEFDAPSKYSMDRNDPTMFTYELLSCGHIHQKREIASSAEAVRVLMKHLAKERLRRRCFECVTGKQAIPVPHYESIPTSIRMKALSLKIKAR